MLMLFQKLRCSNNKMTLDKDHSVVLSFTFECHVIKPCIYLSTFSTTVNPLTPELSLNNCITLEVSVTSSLKG